MNDPAVIAKLRAAELNPLYDTDGYLVCTVNEVLGAYDAAHALSDAFRALLAAPHNPTDLRTLTHVQAARQRVVDAACAYADDPDTWGEGTTTLLSAVREWRRLTALTTEDRP